MAEKVKAKGKRGGNKAYKMPEKFPEGVQLTDAVKTEWTILNSIGTGGFGEIYAGAKASDPAKTPSYAIKIVSFLSSEPSKHVQ